MCYFLGCLVKFTYEVIQSRAFILVSIFITTSFSLFVICSDSLTLSDSVLEDCMFSGIYPFHPYCPICWHTVCNIFYNPLYFSGLSSYFSIFISDCIYYALYYFSISLVKDLSILFIFSKNQILFLLIFCIVFLYFISALIFMIFFFLLT